VAIPSIEIATPCGLAMTKRRAALAMTLRHARLGGIAMTTRERVDSKQEGSG